MPARPSQSTRCSPIADQSEPSQSSRADRPVSRDDQRQGYKCKSFLTDPMLRYARPDFKARAKEFKNNARSPCLSRAQVSLEIRGATSFRRRPEPEHAFIKLVELDLRTLPVPRYHRDSALDLFAQGSSALSR